MRIILLGPPGAGKGTQAKQLALKLNLVHISTGDLLRQNVSKGSSLGVMAKGVMDKGALVPDKLVTQMLSERFSEPDVKNGFILDGYPRNLSQAKTLDELLKTKNMDIHFVAYLDTSDAVIIQRLCGRLVCKACGANFHIKNMPPKAANTCDNCGGGLYQRDDDKVETIKKRIEIYKQETSVLINYYREKEKLYSFSADEEAGMVLGQICSLAGKFNDPLKI